MLLIGVYLINISISLYFHSFGRINWNVSIIKCPRVRILMISTFNDSNLWLLVIAMVLLRSFSENLTTLKVFCLFNFGFFILNFVLWSNSTINWCNFNYFLAVININYRFWARTMNLTFVCFDERFKFFFMWDLDMLFEGARVKICFFTTLNETTILNPCILL